MDHLTINFDVDNTLALRRNRTCELINNRYPDANLQLEDFEQWNFEVEGTGKGIGELIDELLTDDPSYIKEMEAAAPAVEVIREVYEVGANVQIVTHRPGETHQWTKEWLSNHDIPYDEFVEDVPSDKGQVPGDVLIDDHHGNVLDMAEKNRHGILIIQPYNFHSIPDHEFVRTPVEVAGGNPEDLIDRYDEQWDAIRQILGDISRETNTRKFTSD